MEEQERDPMESSPRPKRKKLERMAKPKEGDLAEKDIQIDEDTMDCDSSSSCAELVNNTPVSPSKSFNYLKNNADTILTMDKGKVPDNCKLHDAEMTPRDAYKIFVCMNYLRDIPKEMQYRLKYQAFYDSQGKCPLGMQTVPELAHTPADYWIYVATPHELKGERYILELHDLNRHLPIDDPIRFTQFKIARLGNSQEILGKSQTKAPTRKSKTARTAKGRRRHSTNSERSEEGHSKKRQIEDDGPELSEVSNQASKSVDFRPPNRKYRGLSEQSFSDNQEPISPAITETPTRLEIPVQAGEPGQFEMTGSFTFKVPARPEQQMSNPNDINDIRREFERREESLRQRLVGIEAIARQKDFEFSQKEESYKQQISDLTAREQNSKQKEEVTRDNRQRLQTSLERYQLDYGRKELAQQARISELEKKEQDIKQLEEAHQRRLVDLDDVRRTREQELRKTEALVILQGTRIIELQGTITKLEKDLKDAEAIRYQQMTALSGEHGRQLATLRSAHEKQMVTPNVTHEKQLADLNAEIKRLQYELMECDRVRKIRIADIQKHNKQDKLELQRQIDELQKQSGNTNKTNEQKEAHQRQIVALNGAHDILRAELNQAKASLEKYKKEMADLRLIETTLGSLHKTTEESLRRELEVTKETQKKQIATFMAEHKTKEEAWYRSNEDLNKRLVGLEASHKEELAKLKQEFAEKEAEREKKKLDVMRQVRERIVSIQDKAAEEKKNLIAEHQKRETELRVEILQNLSSSINVMLVPSSNNPQ